MKKVCLVLLVLALLALPMGAAAATKGEVETFVKDAVAYAQEVGKEKALEEFTKKGGKFHKGELYIFAYDFSGTVIGHGAKASLVGKNLIDLRDARGMRVIKALNSIAKRGGGWLQYHWQHPIEKKEKAKLGYVLKVDDSWWLGSGLYK